MFNVIALCVAAWAGAESANTQDLVKAANRIVFEIGSIPVTHEWEGGLVLQNTGDRIIKLHNIQTSCGCLVVHADSDVVLARQKAQLRFILSTAAHVGSFSEHVNIWTDSPEWPHIVVHLKGEVVQEISMTPRHAYFYALTSNATKTISLISIGAKLNAIKIKNKPDWAKLNHQSDGNGFKINVMVDYLNLPPFEMEGVHELVAIIDHPRVHEIPIKIYWQRKSALQARWIKNNHSDSVGYVEIWRTDGKVIDFSSIKFANKEIVLLEPFVPSLTEKGVWRARGQWPSASQGASPVEIIELSPSVH